MIRAYLFVGFCLYPSDLLEETEEVRIIDCGHDPDEDAKYCGECGERLRRTNVKIQLRDDYKQMFDPPEKQYQPVDTHQVFEWLEFKAIRQNYDIDTGRSVDHDSESDCIVVGKQLLDMNVGNGKAKVGGLEKQQRDEALEQVEPVLKDLDIDRSIGTYLVSEVM